MWVKHIHSDAPVNLAELKTRKLFRIRIECEARIGRSSQPSTATTLSGATLKVATLPGAILQVATLPGATLPDATLPGATLVTKPSSSRLPPEATTVDRIRASHGNFLTTLSTGPPTTVAADLKSVALNISSRTTASQPHLQSRSPTSGQANGEASTESNLKKRSLEVQTEKRPKRELETTTQTAT